VSAPKVLVWVLVVGVVGAASFFGVKYAPLVIKEFASDDVEVTQSSVGAFDYQVVAAEAGGDQFALWVADTIGKRELGLGKRQSLPAKQGMLFPRVSEAEECYWMKDMNFSIDIIWLSQTGEIVGLQPKVSPDTYPQTFCTPANAAYTMEVPTGTIERLRLKKGDPVVLHMEAAAQSQY
jgi:uncharacterized membrane protein (UPF0127 family)